jgi:hypothetical protein
VTLAAGYFDFKEVVIRGSASVRAFRNFPKAGTGLAATSIPYATGKLGLFDCLSSIPIPGPVHV